MKKVKGVAVHVLLFALAFIWIFPVIWLVLSSFKDGSELFTYPLTICRSTLLWTIIRQPGSSLT